MTTTTATLRMLLLICISLGQVRLVSMQSVKVPRDGVYLITMVADPDGRTDMFLLFNGNGAGLVAYGLGDAVAGLTAAVNLKAGTTVSVRYTGHSQAASSLGVAFVAYDKHNFLTVGCSGKTSGPGSLLNFYNQLELDAIWRFNKVHADSMRVKTSGIYWVAARPDCGYPSVKVDVGPGLFNVYCDTDRALSASGAFYLEAGTILKIIVKTGWRLECGTIFSFVYLEGNQQKYIKKAAWARNIAYTAYTDRVGRGQAYEKMSFNKSPKPTDYGLLYEKDTQTWLIPKSGSYIVSLRGEPYRETLKVIFYKKNNQFLFAWFNEGIKSGQAGVFQFTEGDELYMTNRYGRYVGPETFMSIALLWVAKE